MGEASGRHDHAHECGISETVIPIPTSCVITLTLISNFTISAWINFTHNWQKSPDDDGTNVIEIHTSVMWDR